LFNSLRN